MFLEFRRKHYPKTYEQELEIEKKQKEKKPLEFSKKIFYMLTGMMAVICIFSMVLMWNTKDSSPLAYLIPGAFGAYSIGIGFYYDKAKKENLNKYGIDIKLDDIPYQETDTISYEDDSSLEGGNRNG